MLKIPRRNKNILHYEKYKNIEYNDLSKKYSINEMKDLLATEYGDTGDGKNAEYGDTGDGKNAEVGDTGNGKNAEVGDTGDNAEANAGEINVV